MTQRGKWLLRIVAGLSAILVLSVVWFCWWISGFGQQVVWQSADGSLELRCIPIEGIAFLKVVGPYDPVRGETWIKIEPGATERRFTRTRLPSINEILKRARITDESDCLGLCTYYDYAPPDTRAIIEYNICHKCDGDPACLETIGQLFQTGKCDLARRSRNP